MVPQGQPNKVNLTCVHDASVFVQNRPNSEHIKGSKERYLLGQDKTSKCSG